MSDVLKIREGRAYLYTNSGSYIRQYSLPSNDKAISGVLEDDEVSIQGSSGKNYIFSKTGSFRRSF